MKAKRFLATLLTLTMIISLLSAFALTVSAEETSGTFGTNGLVWSYNGETKTLTITGKGAMPNYGSSDVKPWDTYKSEIENVIIDYGIDYIGICAFYVYTNIKNISISDSVTTIGDSAFYKCTNLTELYIPNSVTAINDSAFEQCYNLSKLYIGNDVTTIGDRAFIMGESLKSVTIPNSVKTIGKLAFGYSEALDNVVIGSGITSIQDNAFKNSPVTLAYINKTQSKWKYGTSFFTSNPTILYSDSNGYVKFDSTGGYCDTAVAKVNADNKLDSLPVPTKNNANFLGWYDAKTGGNEITADTEFSASKTVYAQWTKPSGPYRIIFESNGGICDTPYEYTNESGKLSQLPAVTKNGCTFEGWYASNGNAVTTDTVFSANATIHAKWSIMTEHTIDVWLPYDVSSTYKVDFIPMLPNDVSVKSLSVTNPAAAIVYQTSPAYSSSRADMTLKTNVMDKPTSGNVIVAISTDNYGTITFTLNVCMVDFEIGSYNSTTNSADITFKQAGTYTVIFADYDGQKLENVETQEITITETSIVPVSITKGFTLDKDDKIMLWSDMTNLVPKCEAYIVK